MKRKFKKLKDETGQAIVELAITLPLLLLLLCGIIDFGWLFFNQLTVANCTREVTRYAIVAGSNETASSLTTKINQKATQLASMYPAGSINVQVTFTKPARINEGDVTVQMTAQVSSLTPVTRFMATNGKIPVSSAVTMRME